MWPSSLHSLELGGAHCPCVSAAIFPGCLWHSWASGLPESSCRHLLLKLVKSSSLASSDHVPWALSFLAHPKMCVYAEGLPSGVSFSEASLQLPPHGWTCAPAPHFGCQQSSLGGSLCWGAAFDPYMDEPPVRPVVLPKDPPSVTDPVRPDSMVWPKWPNPIINFLCWCKFSSCQRQGKACWKLKQMRGQILLCSSNWTCLGSEELLSTGRNERQNYGPLCSENGGKTFGLKIAHQWQRSFFKRSNKSISGWQA